jgi:hypothetical protein
LDDIVGGLPVMPLRSMLRRSSISISAMRFSERLNPSERRSASTSPPGVDHAVE